MRNDVNAFWVTWVGEKRGARKTSEKAKAGNIQFSFYLPRMLRVFRHSFTESAMIGTDGWKIDRNSNGMIGLSNFFVMGSSTGLTGNFYDPYLCQIFSFTVVGEKWISTRDGPIHKMKFLQWKKNISSWFAFPTLGIFFYGTK